MGFDDEAVVCLYRCFCFALRPLMPAHPALEASQPVQKEDK